MFVEFVLLGVDDAVELELMSSIDAQVEKEKIETKVTDKEKIETEMVDKEKTDEDISTDIKVRKLFV